MIDKPLRLLRSSPTRPAHRKCSRLQQFRSHVVVDLTCEQALFPLTPATRYFSAVRPESLSKTARAYHEAARSAVRPDGQQTCQVAEERTEVMLKCEGYCGGSFSAASLSLEAEELQGYTTGKKRWYCERCCDQALVLAKLCGGQRRQRKQRGKQ